jgi:hypothetical protein
MLHLRKPVRAGDAERSDLAMNALSIVYVNAHLQDLLDEATEYRATHVDRPSLLKRIVSAASNAWASINSPLDNRGTMFPALDDSANRS